MLHVMLMVFANRFGRVLTIFDSGPQEAVVPPGVIDFGGQRTSVAEMRRAILKRLGDNNVLVGFHAAWTLMALSLPLPGCRVVDLGAEEAYNLFCFKVSDAFPVWKTLFVERLTNSSTDASQLSFAATASSSTPKASTISSQRPTTPPPFGTSSSPAFQRSACVRPSTASSARTPSATATPSTATSRGSSQNPRSLVDRPHNLPVASL